MQLTADRSALLFRVAKLSAAGFGGLCAGGMCFIHFVGQPAWTSLGLGAGATPASARRRRERLDGTSADWSMTPARAPAPETADSSSSDPYNAVGLDAFRAFLPLASRHTLHLQTPAVLAGLLATALSVRRSARHERLALLAGTALLAAAQLYTVLLMWRTYMALLDRSLRSSDKRARLLYRRWSRQYRPLVALSALGFFALLSAV